MSSEMAYTAALAENPETIVTAFLDLADFETTSGVELASYYAYVGNPLPADHSAILDRLTDEQKLALCAKDIRSRRCDEQLFADVLALSADIGRIRQLDSLLLRELCWITFSQKRWADLRRLTDVLLSRCERYMPSADISDLAFLAFYRQQMGVIHTNDKAAFLAAANAEIERRSRDFGVSQTRILFYQAFADFITMDSSALSRLAKGTIVRPRLAVALRAAESILEANEISEALRGAASFEDLLLPVDHIRFSSRDCVNLIAVDRAYFDLYAERFVASFLRNNGGRNGIHLHCIGFLPTAEWIGAVQRDGADVGCSSEVLPPGYMTIDQRKGYYAAARYVRLPEYLQKYRRIIVSDVDGLIARDIATVFEGAAAIHLSTGLLASGRLLRTAPWEAIAASQFAVERGARSQDFCERVARYLMAALVLSAREGRRFFYSDQNALYHAYTETASKDLFAPIAPVFSGAQDWRMFRGQQAKLDHVVRS